MTVSRVATRVAKARGLLSNSHHKYPSLPLPISAPRHQAIDILKTPSRLLNTMAPRPGPLMPYPVELFSADPRISGTPLKHLRPNKRPHSPGRGSFDSPAKRRLKEEGSISSRHTRSPLSATSNSARFAPDHFQALLQGPDSPAKKLEFGSSKAAASPSAASESTAYDTPRSGSRTPRRSPKRTSTARVRRSPRLSARASSVVSEEIAVEEQLVTRIEVASSSVRVSIPEPVLVPRVVTPPDVQSVHYPGFDIYQDPHIILPSTSSLSHTSTADESQFDKEQEKENFAPPKKSSKQAKNPATPSSAPLIKAALFSPSTRGAPPSVGKEKPVPASPHPKHVCDYLSAAHITPKERTVRLTSSPASTLVGATPGRTPLGKEARRQMRRALENEVDDFDGDDDL